MASPQEFVTVLEHLRTTVYFNVASATILVFDYFLTLPSEVEFIWPSHWTPTKVLFLLSRYLPFLDVGFLFSYSHFLISDVKNCLWVYRSYAWLFFFGTGLTELVLTMRTWAVWNRGRRFGMGLVAFFALCWISCIPIAVVFNNSVDFMLVPSPPFLGCLAVKRSQVVITGWIVLLGYECIFSLMLLKAVQCYRLGGLTGLSLLVFRDGLIYYLYLFAFAITNVAFLASFPPSLQGAMVSAQRVIHPILACRIILDIRSFLSTQRIVMRQPAAVVHFPLPRESTHQSDVASPPGESSSTLDIHSSLPPDADRT